MNMFPIMNGAIAGMITALFFLATVPSSMPGAIAALIFFLVVWLIAAVIERRQNGP